MDSDSEFVHRIQFDWNEQGSQQGPKRVTWLIGSHRSQAPVIHVVERKYVAGQRHENTQT